jgi:hypothetical protein
VFPIDHSFSCWQWADHSKVNKGRNLINAGQQESRSIAPHFSVVLPSDFGCYCSAHCTWRSESGRGSSRDGEKGIFYSWLMSLREVWWVLILRSCVIIHSSFILIGKKKRRCRDRYPSPLVYASIRNGNRHLHRHIPLPASWTSIFRSVGWWDI